MFLDRKITLALNFINYLWKIEPGMVKLGDSPMICGKTMKWQLRVSFFVTVAIFERTAISSRHYDELFVFNDKKCLKQSFIWQKSWRKSPHSMFFSQLLSLKESGKDWSNIVWGEIFSYYQTYLILEKILAVGSHKKGIMITIESNEKFSCFLVFIVIGKKNLSSYHVNFNWTRKRGLSNLD